MSYCDGYVRYQVTPFMAVRGSFQNENQGITSSQPFRCHNVLSIQESGGKSPVLARLPYSPKRYSPQIKGGREIRDMGDSLRSRPLTFVSASQPATGSKQLETGLISAFEPSDTDYFHGYLQHFEQYLILRTTRDRALSNQHVHVRFAPVPCHSRICQHITGEDGIN